MQLCAERVQELNQNHAVQYDGKMCAKYKLQLKGKMRQNREKKKTLSAIYL